MTGDKKTKKTPMGHAYFVSFGQKPKPAHRPKEIRPSKNSLVKLYIENKLSVRKIAIQLDCSKDLIHRALKEYGIDRRAPGEKRSQLADYDFDFLRSELEIKSYSQVAKELDVHTSTLTRYMKKFERKDDVASVSHK